MGSWTPDPEAMALAERAKWKARAEAAEQRAKAAESQRDAAQAAAQAATETPWIWQGDSLDDLDGMSDGSGVSMTAGVLRVLLSEQFDAGAARGAAVTEDNARAELAALRERVAERPCPDCGLDVNGIFPGDAGALDCDRCELVARRLEPEGVDDGQ